MYTRKLDIREWVAARAAPAMFWLSITYLVCLAVLVVLWVDVPNLRENANALANAKLSADHFGKVATQDLFSLATPSRRIESFVLKLMFLIWPIVIFESIMHWITRPWDRETMKYHGFGVLFCICPALRMCARSPEMHGRLWLPGWGWRQADKRLRRRLERQFSIPMIMIALMIMPVLIGDFFLKEQVAEHRWLRVLLHVGTGVIWFSFAAEFILMVSVAEKKLAYCKKHWLDLAIILLPLISFLRSLQTLRATRLAKVMKIQQLSKFARVYRLRGTAVRMFRAFVILEVFSRLLRVSPERSLVKLERQLSDVEAEAKKIKRKILRIERKQRLKTQVARSTSEPQQSGSTAAVNRIE